MNLWAALMVVAGGLFAGASTSVAWSRVPIWRTMPLSQFVDDFAQTLRRTDVVQPALLVTAAVSAAAFAVTSDGSERVLAALGAAGFVTTLVASLVALVPLQRRIVASPASESEAVDEMRRRWFGRNLGRSVLAAASFIATAFAATV